MNRIYKSLTVLGVGFIFCFAFVSNAFGSGAFAVVLGGTGSTTLSGIIQGNGTAPVQTVIIGSGLSYNGTTLSATASSFSYPFPQNATTTVLTFTNGHVSSASTSISTLNLGNPLTVANGGTGRSSLTSSQLLYGNGTGTVSLLATTTLSGSGVISVTAGASTLGSSPITVSCGTCGTGSVTSITGGLGLNGGAITTSGTLSLISYLATSSSETSGQIPYWTTTSGTPAKEGSVATSSIGVSAGLTNTGTLGAQVGGSSLTLKQIENRSFSYATTTGWVGTTTIPLGVGYNEVWNTIKCFTDVGTLNVDFYHAATHFTPLINASTTIGTITTSGTDTAGDKVKVDIGTPASSPTQISCTVNDTI